MAKVSKKKKSVKKVSAAKKAPKARATKKNGAGAASPKANFYDRMKKKKAQLKSGAGFLRMTTNKMRVRVLAFEHDGELDVYAERVTHVKAHPDLPSNIPCQGGDDCPICLLKAEVAEAGHDDLAQDMRAAKRCLINVIDIDAGDNEVKIWEAPVTAVDGIMAYVCDREEYPDVLDPQNGRDFIIEKTGTGFSTKYSVKVAGRATSVTPKGKVRDLVEFVEQQDAKFDWDALTAKLEEIEI